MNKKQQRTLDAIFDTPIRSNVVWSDIEKLFISLGAEVSEGNGSRVRIALKGVRSTFHRHHPQKETDKGALRSVQRFLNETGVLEDEV